MLIVWLPDFSATLALLPIAPSDQLASRENMSELSGVISVTVMLPFDREEEWTKWLTSLRKCYQHTIRSLSFSSSSSSSSSSSDSLFSHGRNVDLEQDTHQSIKAILATGLPMPKSPSVQMEEMDLGQAGDTATQEREERGWWSLRFQQVFRELQRKDAPLFAPLEARTLGESNAAGYTQMSTIRTPGIGRRTGHDLGYAVRDTYS